MTPSEQAQVEATLHIHWGQHPHLTTDWGDTGLTPIELTPTRLDGTAP